MVFEDISERQAQTWRMERDLEQLATIRRIRGALADDGFLLYAQPIIDLSSGAAVQQELLIRMRDPNGDGVLGPGTPPRWFSRSPRRRWSQTRPRRANS